jgi:hypothetical protein
MPYDASLGPGNEYYIDEMKNLVYQLDSQGRRHYLSPAAMTPEQLRMSQQEQATGQPRDAEQFISAGFDRSKIPDGGLFKGRGEWNAQEGKFDQPTNWGNIAALGIGGAIGGLALPSALGAFGGGGAAGGAGGASAAASGVLPSSALPSAATSAGMFGPMAGIPAAGGAAGAAGAAGGGMASNIARGAAQGAGGRAVDAAVAGLAGLPGLFGGGPSQEEEALTRLLQQMLAQQQGRTQHQEPLFRAVTQMGANLMPNSAWPGGKSPY